MTRSITTSKLYHIIYKRCIKGDTQKNIKIFIKDNYSESYEKSYISKIVRDLIGGGYLQCLNPTSRDKLYVATKKPFVAKNDSLVYKLPSSKSERLHGRCDIVQIQKSTFITQIKHGPYKNIKWDRTWCINGLNHFIYSHPFENLGTVRFQRMVSSGTDQLKIILPRILWNKDEGNPREFLKEIADRVGTWFMKRFKIELVGLRVCSKPHFAMVLTDPRLIKIAQEGTYRINDFMVDASPPHNIPEIESEDYFDLIELTECPKEIAKMKIEIQKIKADISEICESVTEVNNTISELKVQLNEFFKSFCSNQISDTLEGYA